MQFEADVDADLVELLKDGEPARAEFLESFVDQAGGALWPGIEERPCESAGKSGVRVEAEVAAGLGGPHELLHGPRLACFEVAGNFRRSKAAEKHVVGRMAGHELSLQMSRKLGDGDACAASHAKELVAIALALRSLFQVEESRVPGRDLNAGEAEFGGPAGHAFKRVERSGVPGKLRKKNSGAFDGLHDLSPRRC